MADARSIGCESGFVNRTKMVCSSAGSSRRFLFRGLAGFLPLHCFSFHRPSPKTIPNVLPTNTKSSMQWTSLVCPRPESISAKPWRQ